MIVVFLSCWRRKYTGPAVLLCLWLASVAARLLTGSCAVVHRSGCVCRRAASSCSALTVSLAAHAHRRAGGLARQDGGAAQGGCGDFWRHG